MGIGIQDELVELAVIARSLLESRGATDVSRSLLEADVELLPEFWTELADIGWLGLHLPEDVGGSGFGLEELVIVVEALGHASAPGPFVPSVIASAVIHDLGAEDQRAELLPGLAAGQRIAAFGSVTAGRGVALGAGPADLLVLVDGDDVLVIQRAGPGVHVELPRNIDPTRRSGRIRLDNVLPLARFPGGGRRAVAIARTIAAAECTGGAEACTRMAVEYAKERHQFGRPIGTFQAVKHHCADMLVSAELAAAATWGAARAFAGDPERFELAAAVAGAVAVPAFGRVAQCNVQVHGGVGYTWEHDAHLYVRRSIAVSSLFDPVAASADVARLMAAGTTIDRSLDLHRESDPARTEVRAVASSIASLSGDAQRARLIVTGYLVPHWPSPWGRAADAREQLVIEDELARAGVVRPELGITGWVILTLIQHGTDEQVERWVRPSLEGRLQWCQLFSEPDAGSDAAGIRTSAARVDGGWLVRGQKVWTSGARESQFGLATVRTDPLQPKHKGITTMVIDLGSPGVDIRPLRTMTGTSEFNEVFLDAVFVPDDAVVGTVDAGWTVARAVLTNERVSLGGRAPGDEGEDLCALLPHQPTAVTEVGELLATETALELLNLRQAARAVAGGPPGPEGNITKLLLAECAQRRASVTARLLRGDVAFAEGPGGEAAVALLGARRLAIAGGTSEITRNQIAERLLGLPRDPLLI